MLSLLWKYRQWLVIVGLVGLIVAIVAVQRKDEDDYNLFDRILVRGVGPVQRTLERGVTSASDALNDYVLNRQAAKENHGLRRQVRDLKVAAERSEETTRQNHRLLSLLNLLDRSHDVRYLGAQVIGESPGALFRALRIDVGSDDGVIRGMGVLADVGVVGRVIAVDKHFSDVMMLTDVSSSLDVYVAHSRARGRLRGTADALTPDVYIAKIDYLVRSAAVEPGDEVLTTGAGVVFPKGLLVGWVRSVNKVEHGLYQEVVVEPAAPLHALDEVLVVLTFGPAAIVDRPISSAATQPAPEEPEPDPLKDLQ